MKVENVEIYSEVSNNAVIKLNGRNFPGSLIQGDSLHILVSEIMEAKEAIREGNSEEASEILGYVLERLNDRLTIYIDALTLHKLELPFFSK
jgi:hypothetical protein